MCGWFGKFLLEDVRNNVRGIVVSSVFFPCAVLGSLVARCRRVSAVLILGLLS